MFIHTLIVLLLSSTKISKTNSYLVYFGIVLFKDKADEDRKVSKKELHINITPYLTSFRYFMLITLGTKLLLLLSMRATAGENKEKLVENHIN